MKLKPLESAPAEFGDNGKMERSGVPSREKGRGPTDGSREVVLSRDTQ